MEGIRGRFLEIQKRGSRDPQTKGKTPQQQEAKPARFEERKEKKRKD